MNLLVRDTEEPLKLLCERFLMGDVVEVLFMMGDQLTNNGVYFLRFFNFFGKKLASD